MIKQTLLVLFCQVVTRVGRMTNRREIASIKSLNYLVTNSPPGGPVSHQFRQEADAVADELNEHGNDAQQTNGNATVFERGVQEKQQDVKGKQEGLQLEKCRKK